MKDWEGGRKRTVKRSEPAPEGLFPPQQDSKGREPQVGLQELGPLPGESSLGPHRSASPSRPWRGF